MDNVTLKDGMELAKMVDDSKKKFAKRKTDDVANEKKAEAKDNVTLKDGMSKIQKVKNEIKTKLKVIADSEKEVRKDQKAAKAARNQIADLRDKISDDRQ